MAIFGAIFGATVVGGSTPTVAIVSPTPGVDPGDPGGFSDDWDVARLTPIVLEIDAADGLTFAVLVARFPGEAFERVVYRRGSFRGGFAAVSTSEIDGTILRLSILPDYGWPSYAAIEDITFDIDAVSGGALSDIGASS